MTMPTDRAAGEAKLRDLDARFWNAQDSFRREEAALIDKERQALYAEMYPGEIVGAAGRTA